MEHLSFLLAGLSLALIFIEFFFPSGICALLTLASMGSSIFFFSQTHTLLSTVFFSILLFSLAMVVGILAFKKMKKQLVLHKTQEVSLKKHPEKEERGIALTDLSPSGWIIVHGKKEAAVSLWGFIEKGSAVTVIEWRENRCIVRKQEK